MKLSVVYACLLGDIDMYMALIERELKFYLLVLIAPTTSDEI